MSFPITVLHDGRELKARILTLSPSRITLETIEPAGYHLLQQRSFFNRCPDLCQDGDLTPYVQDWIKKSLIHVDRCCQYCEANFDELVDIWSKLTDYFLQQPRFQMTDEKFWPIRQQLRKQLRKGEINNAKYQQLLTPYAKQHRAFKSLYGMTLLSFQNEVMRSKLEGEWLIQEWINKIQAAAVARKS